MGVMATWGKKTFEVNKNRIMGITGLSTAYKLKEETNNDSSTGAQTNAKGRELEELDFTVTYVAGAVKSVRNEFGSWRNLIGEVNQMVIGGVPFGPPKWQLISASISDTMLDTNGNFLQASVELLFREYSESSSSTSTSSTGTNSGAKDATASSTDKSSKSPYGTTSSSATTTSSSSSSATGSGASKILSIAKAEIGVAENPLGSNKVKYNTEYYGKAVSGSAYPWCCVFVWWVFKQAGLSKFFYNGSKTAACATLMSWFKNQKRFYTTGFKPGDIVFFNFDGGSTARHVGIILSVSSDKNIVVIEGNSSNKVSKVTRKSAILGVGRPAY